MQHRGDASVLHHVAPGQLRGGGADAAAISHAVGDAVGRRVVVHRLAVAVVHRLGCSRPGAHKHSVPGPLS